MTAVVEVPADQPPVPELDVCADGGPPRCDVVTTSVRAAAIAMAESADESRAHGLPSSWEGVAADTAGYALAVFGRDADVVTAALETATRALDVYDGEMVDLARQRDDLEGDRLVLNRDLHDLRARVAALAGTDPAPVVLTRLRDEADLLRCRHVAFDGAVVALDQAVRAAEERLVAVLAGVDTTGEAERAADDPARPDPLALVRGLGAVGGDPGAVHDWWLGLSDAEREAVKVHLPEAIGGLDGIPAADRDDVNRALLERDVDHLRELQGDGRLTERQEQTLRSALGARDALYDDDTVVDPVTGDPVRRLLLLYDPDAFGGDGAGAVALGDPDAADDTLVMVPGFGNDLTTLADRAEDARRIYEDAVDQGLAPPTIVTWIGYDAPNLDVDQVGPADLVSGAGDAAAVADESKAVAGGDSLARFVDGLRASDVGDPSHLTLLGHSYGSTTAAEAAAAGADVDDLVLTGSPGAGHGHDDVGDLGLTSDHVFVGAVERDPITWLGGDSALGLGPDPAQESFDATRFETWEGRRFRPDDLGTGFDDNHGSYVDDGSRSLGNITRIAVGEDPVVVDGRDTPARDRLVAWAAGSAIEPFAPGIAGGVEVLQRGRDVVEIGGVIGGALW